MEWFADVVVHTSLQASFAVPLHGVGGHGDDRQFGPFRVGAYETSGLEPVHLRHLHVHKNQVEVLLLQQLHSDLAILSGRDLMTGPLQQSLGQLAVNQIVFGQQDVQALRCLWFRARFCFGNLLHLFRHLLSQRVDNSIKQHRLFNRLGDIGRPVQILPVSHTTQGVHRCQHDNRQCFVFQGPTHLPEHIQSIHVRHLHIEQHQVERTLALLGKY